MHALKGSEGVWSEEELPPRSSQPFRAEGAGAHLLGDVVQKEQRSKAAAPIPAAVLRHIVLFLFVSIQFV